MTDIAVAICMGVAETSWPMGTRVAESFDQRESGRRTPVASPWWGRRPVGTPKPKRVA